MPGRSCGGLAGFCSEADPLSAGQGVGRDFMLMGDWGKIAIPQWPLIYRNDKRNWRLAGG